MHSGRVVCALDINAVQVLKNGSFQLKTVTFGYFIN